MQYLDNVLPGEHGSPRHLFFFLDPYYWGWKKPKIRMKDTKYEQLNILIGSFTD